VVTDAYRRAAEALDKHSFVLLVGEPAAGKTTIASMLAMAAIDQWGASTLKLEDPAKVVDHWDPEEPSQFFWIDDAFGVTQYEDFLVRGWNHVFLHIGSMLHKGAKIVMTSRDYIYNRARKDLKESAFPLLRRQGCIDVRCQTGRSSKSSTTTSSSEAAARLSVGDQPHLEMITGTAGSFLKRPAPLRPLFTKDLFLDPYYSDSSWRSERSSFRRSSTVSTPTAGR
jgi:energy-coupling factor transporter ATP-binding protein EcfA2